MNVNRRYRAALFYVDKQPYRTRAQFRYQMSIISNRQRDLGGIMPVSRAHAAW